MLALGVGLGLAAPAPLGRMDSQEVSDFTADYSQLQVLQPAADMHQVAAPDIAEDTEHAKEAASDMLKAAKELEHEKSKASREAEKTEAREELNTRSCARACERASAAHTATPHPPCAMRESMRCTCVEIARVREMRDPSKR